MSLWLPHSAVNRKFGGLSPPRDAVFFLQKMLGFLIFTFIRHKMVCRSKPPTNRTWLVPPSFSLPLHIPPPNLKL